MTIEKKRPKVLLAYPNFHEYFVPFLPFYEPFVFILLGSIIKELCDVEIFDRRYETEKAWKKKLKEFKPDLIGCRVHTSGELSTTERMFTIAKEICPSALTLVGGQHPTLLPDDFNLPCVDMICIGPGEETLKEIVTAIGDNGSFDGIKGLAIRKNGALYFTPEREIRSGVFSWPKLDRSLVKKYSWRFPQGITVTTHGCPHRCKFCSLWFTARGTYRLRAADEIADDIASIKQKYVYIADDNTFHDHIHSMKIHDALKKRGVKKRYGAYARSDTIVEHPELFEKWKELGLHALVVGFEVVGQDDLDRLNKRTTLDNNLKTLEILNRLKIYCYAHFIVFPEFTLKDFRDLWSFVDKHKISQPYFVPLTPSAGTILFKEAKDEGLLSIFDYGFYNLEYMVYKTKLPKLRFYFEFLLLYLRSISPLFYWKVRSQMTFDTYLYRIFIILRLIPKYTLNVLRQIHQEKTKKYDDIESTLPPSLRKGYKFRYIDDASK